MIAGVLSLNWQDVQKGRVTDDYSIHRLLYDLFEDKRSEEEKRSHCSSGFLYAEGKSDGYSKEILFLSDREPKAPKIGTVRIKLIPASFLKHDNYAFEVVVNPTKRNKSGKIVSYKTRDEILEWFEKRSTSWGFSVLEAEIVRSEISRFNKGSQRITLKKTTIKGLLNVTDRELFVKSFEEGLGRGRAFGCGLLRIVPLRNF